MPVVSTDDAGAQHVMAGMRMSDVNPLVGAGAARQGRCQQVKENLQVKQVTVADVDVRVIICHKPSACFGLAAFTYLLALFSVHPLSDPDHNREFALGAKTASHRLATSLQVFALIPLILCVGALLRDHRPYPGSALGHYWAYFDRCWRRLPANGRWLRRVRDARCRRPDRSGL